VFEVGVAEAFTRLKNLVVNWAKDVFSTVIAPLKKVGSFVSGLFGGETHTIDVSKVRIPSVNETVVQGARNVAAGLGTEGEGARRVIAGVESPGSLAGGIARARPGVGQGPMVTNAPKTNVQIDVKASPGMDEEKLAQATAREVSKVIDKQNRSAMNALVPSLAGVSR
jgi:hypothetical protein